jgi:hypothetical protein
MSDSYSFLTPEIISKRLHTYHFHLKRLADSSTDVRLLLWQSDDTKRVVSELIQVLQDELSEKIKKIESMSDQARMAEQAGIARAQLEQFVHYVEHSLSEVTSVLSDERSVGRELYYLVLNVLTDLGLAALDEPTLERKGEAKVGHPRKNVAILINRGESVAVQRLSHKLVEDLTFFPRTFARGMNIENSPWLLSVPVSVLRNPLNWVAVLHEMGHVAEEETIRALDQVRIAYERKDGAFDSYNSTSFQRLISHLSEYQADFIAYLYGGYSYVRIMLLNEFTREIGTSSTHPDWLHRMRILRSEYLSPILEAAGIKPSENRGYDRDAEYPRYEKLVKAPHGNLITDEFTDEWLRTILVRTAKYLASTTTKRFGGEKPGSLVFNPEDYRRSTVFAALAGLVPYTRDFRYVMAAGTDSTAYDSAIATLRRLPKTDTPRHNSETMEGPSTKEDKEVAEEFNRYVANTIRLCYIRSRYTAWTNVPRPVTQLTLGTI